MQPENASLLKLTALSGIAQRYYTDIKRLTIQRDGVVPQKNALLNPPPNGVIRRGDVALDVQPNPTVIYSTAQRPYTARKRHTAVQPKSASLYTPGSVQLNCIKRLNSIIPDTKRLNIQQRGIIPPGNASVSSTAV